MAVFAVTMVRDEEDIVAETVGRMVRQVDHVIVADNGSTDRTREILEGLDVEVVDDPEVGYYQSQKMTGLAERARAQGADWVVPFDADEMWLAAEGRIAALLDALPAEAMVCEAALFDHVPTSLDGSGPPVERMEWRRAEQAPLRKVAVRAREGLTIHQGNHSAAFEGDPFVLRVAGQLQVRHFPYRSPEQFIRKARNGAAAYAATDLPESTGAHWRQYGASLEEQGENALISHFTRWFHSDDPEGDGLLHDPCPR
jgi:hypothetical protein